jgi:AcrR family transcriptional regulator
MTSRIVGRPDGPAPLTRELVLRTSLAIIDRDGVDGLSMRRLGHTLGRDPMTFYRYAPSKAAVLDGVVELVLEQLEVETTDPDWAGQLRAVARAYRDLALTHPRVVPLLVTRPLSTPLGLRPLGTLRPLEAILELLTRAGFTDVDALHIYRSFIGFLHGHILDELQELVDNHDETDELLRLGLQRLPLREFPLLRGLAPALTTYDGAAQLERGLDILLSGLHTQLPAATAPPPDRPGDPATAPASARRPS